MRRLGLIGGMSWESTAVYYRLLNEGVRDRLGGHSSADLVLVSVNFAEISVRQRTGDWDGLAAMMADAAVRLERAGVDAILICTNTMHKVAAAVEAAVDVPLLHIADCTGTAIAAAGARRPLLLATLYTMEQDFYRGRLRDRLGVEIALPAPEDRRLVNDVIYGELVNGIIEPASRRAFLDVIARNRPDGIDGVIFGCTEVGLLITPSDIDLPAFDSVALHAAAALDFALD